MMHFKRHVFLTSLIGISVVGLGWFCVAAPPKKKPHPAPHAEKVSYYHQIRPILMAKCLPCHSAANHAGMLDVTSYAALLKGGAHGPAFVKGQPAKSLIVGYLHGKPMLMPKGGPPLPKEQIALIEKWIAQGAVDDTPKPHGKPSQQKVSHR
ncbi:c-type cytochrome domain-containing protein [Chthonomonas calidirosea]|uniref:c-type cytochrome domain-containing protein n=1 Tax=Chthonomonas calidirosea TaxID=454171 RepID=UPI00039DCBBC|nr:c-type cytochrome domain-containing protein [Chthonomonas calidirosea]